MSRLYKLEEDSEEATGMGIYPGYFTTNVRT